jgi:hypothetical protein
MQTNRKNMQTNRTNHKNCNMQKNRNMYTSYNKEMNQNTQPDQNVKIYNDVFNELQDYILNDKNMQKSLELIIHQPNKKCVERHETKKMTTSVIANKGTDVKKPDIFIPNLQDTLFWCFYIMKNGDTKYETMAKNTLVAKQLKIELVNTIRKNKDIIKMYKFDSITNTESNLANDDLLNITTFFSLCAIENINAIFIKKNTYFELLMNDSDVIYIIREMSPAKTSSNYHVKYGFEMGTKEIVDNIRGDLYKIDKLGKPIKAISAYTISDLITICNKLAIETTNKDTGKNKLKNELYESIIQHF